MKMKGNFFRYILVLISLIFFMQSVPLYAASMTDYCLIPPYVKRDVLPNILITMDNAEIMGEAAYTDTYTSSKTYSGLFKSDLMYTYGSNQWVPDAAGIYKGNLLNWATTSKYDLLQSILLGGKSASRQTNINTLQSISNSWTKTLTYTDGAGRSRVCIFVVSGANVEIKDDTAGSCGYLDSPAYPLTSSNESYMRFAMNASGAGQRETITEDSILNDLARQASGFVSSLINFLVPDAEAAAPLRLPSGNPPAGTECTAYSATMTASGGTETGYTWSIISGSLPAGLTMSSSGTPSTTISGTPTVASGTYTFTLQICDDAGCIDKHIDSESYDLVINDATVTISTASPMTDGTVGSWYRAPIRASGPCTGTTTWSKTSGTLPPGLSLGACTSGSDCVDLSGTPTTAGIYNFTVQVTDSKSNISSKAFSITINAAPGTFTITTSGTLTVATEGVAYQTDITTSGYSCSQCCSCGWTWSITSGSLPPGLSLNTSGPCLSGDHVYITGTPTSTGTYSFSIQVTASSSCGGATATKAFSVTVNTAPVTIRTTGNQNVKVCAGDYSINCSNPDTTFPYDPPCSPSYTDQCVLKTGIVDQFWPYARYGLEDFQKQGGVANPEIAKCIVDVPGTNPDSDFLTAIENAVPIPVITTLVDGQYTSVDYYANDTSNNCDPFRNSQDCQMNFVLMITSGVGADNPPNPSGGTPSVFADATNCGSSSLYNLSKNTCFGFNNDLRNSPIFGGDNLGGTQNLNTYIVNTMGVNGNILSQAATAGGGNYYNVTDPTTLRQYLIQAFQDILKRAAAGTAASVLASGEGSGANLIQAVFYPRKKFFNSATGAYDEISWIGRLTNFWYYIDPFFSTSTILEDTTTDKILNLSNDDKVKFRFDPTIEGTLADRYAFGSTTKIDSIPFEYVNYLWEAGVLLWNRDLATSPRTIYTTTGTDGDSDGYIDRINFSTANASTLQTSLQAATATEAARTINYMHGYDKFCYGTSTPCNQDADCSGVSCETTLRTRTVSVDINGDGDTLDTVNGISENPSKVWKLGDILNSTPRLSSWIQLGNYESIYNDQSYKAFISTADYKSRGMVFAGGNDGMLHAFKLGTLELTWSTKTSSQIAQITGSDLGKEMWAFIPKNALPYLKYATDPGYCHIYTVDLSPYVFDTSIGAPASGDISNNTRPSDGSSWRTILIGGMRFGGASRDTSSSCTDCVKTPISGQGYSSYFALDITDQSDPKVLWEFSNADLGFTTTGPTIIRVGDRTKNGKWFVVLGSGPTGPISTVDQQFLGRSDQNLRLFILDLKTGTLLRTIDTGITYAFAGSMINDTIDNDLNYQDDAAYIGYVKKAGDGTWTNGGVLRLFTKSDTNPSNWAWSKVIDDIGPVTSSVTKLQNNSERILWLYFGTGRYYYEQATTIDDQTNQRRLFGIKEPCFTSSNTLDTTCSTQVSTGSLTDVTAIGNVPSEVTANAAGFSGWYINLDLSGSFAYPEGDPPASVTKSYMAERIITDPLASTSGLVFFTSYKPYNDVCAYGGKSFVWVVRYNTGGAPTTAILKGIALLQVSTGSIEQIGMASQFTYAGGRKTAAMEGVPPTAQGLSILSPPPAIKRILHMRER
jgi:uncharacterized protein YbcV (DUF1398 family)